MNQWWRTNEYISSFCSVQTKVRRLINHQNWMLKPFWILQRYFFSRRIKYIISVLKISSHLQWKRRLIKIEWSVYESREWLKIWHFYSVKNNIGIENDRLNEIAENDIFFLDKKLVCFVKSNVSVNSASIY